MALSDDMRARVKAAWPDLLARIANGDAIHDALAAVGLTADAARRYRGLDESAAREWRAAREDSAHALFDELRRIADEPAKGKDEAAAKRAKAEIYRWIIQKLDPKTYSDKTHLELGVKVDLTPIVSAAAARLAAHHAIRIAAPNSAGALAPARAQDVLEAEIVPEPALADLQ